MQAESSSWAGVEKLFFSWWVFLKVSDLLFRSTSFSYFTDLKLWRGVSCWIERWFYAQDENLSKRTSWNISLFEIDRKVPLVWPRQASGPHHRKQRTELHFCSQQQNHHKFQIQSQIYSEIGNRINRISEIIAPPASAPNVFSPVPYVPGTP